MDVRAETDRRADARAGRGGWPGHRAGQHLDVRLIAEDGYRAERTYSIASAPEAAAVKLTIERLDDGEVSPYLVRRAASGDGLEVRGPIGGYFVWDVRDRRTVLLIAGGSGVVPLMAMLRHRSHADASKRARCRCACSTRRAPGRMSSTKTN